MDPKTRNIALAITAAVIIIALVVLAPGLSGLFSKNPVPAGSDEGRVVVFFFYGEECPHCHEVMPFIESLRTRYPEVDFRILETWHNKDNAALFSSMEEQLNVPETNRGVPTVIIGKNVLVGSKQIPEELEQLIINQKKT